MVDRKFYADIKDNLLGEWMAHGAEEISKEFDLDAERVIILGLHAGGNANVKEYFVDGRPFERSWARSEQAFFKDGFMFMAYKHKLGAGRHVVMVKCAVNQGVADIKLYLFDFRAPMSAVTQDRVVGYPACAQYPENHSDVDLSGFHAGAGDGFASVGRFGFTKGDGLLDCAMTTLGGINRMHLFGHPDYRKNTRWQYSVLPRAIQTDQRLRGSFAPAQGFDPKDVDVNYLSVKWKAVFKRLSGADVNFACSYSLASAGIMVETDEDRLTISELEYAGNYTRVLLPLKHGLVVRDISCGVGAYDCAVDGELQENWFLLFGATEFPDIPIQVVMQKQPQSITLERMNGLLSVVEIVVGKDFGAGFMVSPFGIEAFKPGATFKEEFVRDAYARCHFWSCAVLAYPVDVAEYYALENDSGKVRIAQKFKYRIIDDEWGTVPLQIAPLPPVLSLLDGVGMVETEGTAVDFRFPTKYGFLRGAVGSAYSVYKIPFMPCARIFPLKNSGDNPIAHLFADGLDEYFVFQDKFDEKTLAWPYAGACMEPYAATAALFNFMDEKHRRQIARKAAERLSAALDLEKCFRFPINVWTDLLKFVNKPPSIDQSLAIYGNPNNTYVNFYNWYQRREPFSGADYRACYLNVGLYPKRIGQGDREEVLNYSKPLIENDWGLGQSLYQMYLCALVSGDFTPIRENWETIKAAYKYYELFHDWACMGAGYAENGVAWVEGANYGAFTAFVNMADAVERKADYARGVYLAAKQQILRLAVFRSAQTYFCRFFGHAPWYITKLLPEEVDPHNAFLSVPDLWADKYRVSGFYNLTTEGLYPEILCALNKFLPDEFAQVREMVMAYYADCPQTTFPGVEPWLCLMAGALNETFSETQLLREIDEADERGLLMKQWRSVGFFCCLHPKNYFRCLLLAWFAKREHPFWLEHWVDVEIMRAEYEREEQKAVLVFKLNGKGGRFRFGVRRPPQKVILNGAEIKGKLAKNATFEVEVAESGTLEVR